MDAPWRIELLGWLRAVHGDRVVSRFRRQKTGVLLAYLAYYPQRSHARDALTEMLWPERDPEAGRRDLRVALSSLRHQLEPPGVPPGAVLITDRACVQLNPAACTTDVAAFEAALQAASRAGGTECLQRLEEAVTLYRGELLPGYFEEWLMLERQRLAEAFSQALEQLIRLLEQGGDLRRALHWARRAVSADPVREEGHRELIRLLVASGQPEAALRQYQELERLLDQELGAAPEATTLALIRQIQTEQARRVSEPCPPASLPLPAPVLAPAPSERVAALASPEPLPSGTVTFLMTDIEGHTALWERAGNAFAVTLEAHHALLRQQFRQHGGYELKEMGDGFLVAFPHAGSALACAIASQRALAAHPWPQVSGTLWVRMALHTGDVRAQEGDYHGLVLNLASRMLLAGHGGQILLSEGTASLLRRDLEPGVRLVDLGVYRLRDVVEPERLFQVEYPEMARRVFPRLRAEARDPGHLPPSFTRFFGREAEITRLRELLLAEAESGDGLVPAHRGSVSGPGPGRLVTLTGPAGTGKTRLALVVAAQLQEAWRGAVWFVPLGDLAEARLIAEAIQQVLCLSRSPGVDPLVQVVTTLARQPSFLLLDGVEHLVPEGAPLVERLLARIPKLTLLVTSRRRLDLPGEREFPVPPLPTPQMRDTPEQLLECASVRLFVDRAQAVRPDFQVTPANAATVAALCERLEGIPLALELAAARAGVLTPAQMLARLEQRFKLLTRRRREGEERHWSLRAALDWSYQLLSPELQRFFAQLSIFRGGWALEAAEAVAEEPEALDYLEQLCECTLVVAEEGGEEMRYRLLETLREYAAEQVATEEWAALGRRHALFFLALAEEAEPQFATEALGECLKRLDRDHDNLRAALGWSLENGETEWALRFGRSLWRFWYLRCHIAEGRKRMADLLAVPAENGITRARVLHGAGMLAYAQGDYEAARSLYEASLQIFKELEDRQSAAATLTQLGAVTLYQRDYQAARALYEESLAISKWLGDRPSIATSLTHLGFIALRESDYGAAWRFYQASLAVRRELADKRGTVAALGNLGIVALRQGDYTVARALYEESLGIRRELDDRRAILTSLHNLAEVVRCQADWGAARALYEESLTIERELANKRNVAGSLQNLADVVSYQGDYEAACSLYEESLSIHRELGDDPGIVRGLARLAGAAAAQGRPERAARLFGAAEALREASGTVMEPGERAAYECAVATARAQLREDEFASAWVQGRAMPLDQALEYALAEVGRSSRASAPGRAGGVR
jgi:predicted ATPase/DNA-binding SARP family transcriptional activator/class 3 adenylate cyclase